MTDTSEREQGGRRLGSSHAQFRRALKHVVKSCGLTQERIASRAGVPATTFSGYLTGYRLPKEAASLTCVYAVMEEHAAKSHHVLPWSLEDLERLRSQALLERCGAHSGDGAPRVGEAPGKPQSPVAELPAPLRRARTRLMRQRVRLYGRRRIVRPREVPVKVPVPPQQGDRHVSFGAQGDGWVPETEEVLGHFAAGRDWDAYMVLRNTASTASAHEIPEIVSACRSAGMEDAVEIVLRAAAQRDTRAVLNITAALHERRQFDDAGVVLAAARSH
ncbi:hypothetical protein [Streptomyces sp. NPDC001889]